MRGRFGARRIVVLTALLAAVLPDAGDRSGRGAAFELHSTRLTTRTTIGMLRGVEWSPPDRVGTRRGPGDSIRLSAAELGALAGLQLRAAREMNEEAIERWAG